jgi:hypothetical protein
MPDILGVPGREIKQHLIAGRYISAADTGATAPAAPAGLPTISVSAGGRRARK